MKYRSLTQEELEKCAPGEAITVATIMSLMAAALMAVIIYRLYMSKKGSATIPGGWKFNWDK